MNALYSVGHQVPLARVIREHRAALLPLAIVLVINAALLVAVVLPLSQRVQANETRVENAERALTSAEAEFRQAEALRDGKARATTDLDMFYKQVLPGSISAARRIMELQLRQKAREHGVRFQRSDADEEDVRDSALDRLTYSMTWVGDYDDIRSFIYDLETSAEFVVIDNLVLAEGVTADAPLTLSIELSTYYRSAARLTAEANGR